MLQIRVVPTLLDVATLCRNEVTNGIRKARTFFIWVFFSILCLGRQGQARLVQQFGNRSNLVMIYCPFRKKKEQRRKRDLCTEFAKRQSRKLKRGFFSQPSKLNLVYRLTSRPTLKWQANEMNSDIKPSAAYTHSELQVLYCKTLKS